jgi:hypothetical protein
METNVSNEIKKRVEKGPVVLSRVFKNTNQKEGTLTAEFKQTITTTASYPTKSVSNSLQDNFFSATEDFGFPAQEYKNSSTRVTWINVPESFTEEMVKERVKDISIQQIISNFPILSSEQMYAIGQGITTLEAIADRQLLRYPQGSEDAGKVILDSNTGKPMYKVNVAKRGQVEDIDLRGQETPEYFAPLVGEASYYASEATKQELGVASGVVSQNQLFN